MRAFDIEAPPIYQVESLPSYTLVTGLPTYEDAMKQQTTISKSHYAIYRPSIFNLFDSNTRTLKAKIDLSSSGLKSIPHECRISVVMPPSDFDHFPSICEKNRIEEVNETEGDEITTISGAISKAEVATENEKERTNKNRTRDT
jgi:hypothetical protein